MYDAQGRQIGANRRVQCLQHDFIQFSRAHPTHVNFGDRLDLGEVTAGVLGHLPEGLPSKVLEAAPAAGNHSPELVVDTLGTEAIAKHAPTPVLWSCFVTAGLASFGMFDVKPTWWSSPPSS